jgi:hypothetical protein
MKKFLVFLLVLGLATVSQSAVAGLVFTVNGEPQPTEITIGPSQSIELDLEIDAQVFDMDGFTLDYKILNDRAELLTAGIVFPRAFDFGPSATVFGPQWIQISGAQMFTAGVAGPQVLMHGLMLHCLALDPQGQPTILQIIVSGATLVNNVQLAPVGTVIHTLLINQVPEPATLMLLGLGSLFLLRKKK